MICTREQCRDTGNRRLRRPGRRRGRRPHRPRDPAELHHDHDLGVDLGVGGVPIFFKPISFRSFYFAPIFCPERFFLVPFSLFSLNFRRITSGERDLGEILSVFAPSSHRFNSISKFCIRSPEKYRPDYSGLWSGRRTLASRSHTCSERFRVSDQTKKIAKLKRKVRRKKSTI